MDTIYWTPLVTLISSVPITTYLYILYNVRRLSGAVFPWGAGRLLAAALEAGALPAGPPLLLPSPARPTHRSLPRQTGRETLREGRV